MRHFATIAFLCSLGLAACGGGGGGGGGGDGAGSSRLNVSASAIKTLTFRWDAVAGVSHYRLFEDVDGEAGPQVEQLISQPSAGQHSFTQEDVFLPTRVNARYRLQACGISSCRDLDRTGIEGIDAGIGYFKASNPAAYDQFGHGLALSADGQLLAVGAPYEDGLNEGIGSTPERGAQSADIGAVYVFHRGAAGWVQEAYLKPAKALPGANFGDQLALAGDRHGYTLLVGAPLDPSGGSGVGADPEATPAVAESGAAHVFERDAAGQWTQTQYWKAPTPAESWYGFAVSLSADAQWAAVGQPFASQGGQVHLYRREATGWAFKQTISGGNTRSDDALGYSLQLDPTGTVLVAGAWGQDGATATADSDSGSVDAGAAYLFERDASGLWSETAYLKAPTPRPKGYFGTEVALSSGGSTIVVSEPGDSAGGTRSMEQLAHVFQKQGNGWVHQVALALPRPQARAGYGFGLALSADGSTLALSDSQEASQGSGLSVSPTIDAGYGNAGSAYLYRRTAAGTWSDPVPLKSTHNASDRHFGAKLAMSANGGTLAVTAGDHSLTSGIGGNPIDDSAPWIGSVFLY